MKSEFALVSIKTVSSKGLEDLKQALKGLAEKFLIHKVSSVYKVHRIAESLSGLRDIRKEEILDGLTLVVKVETRLSPEATLYEVEQVEAKMQKEVLRRTVSMNLLCYGNQIVMVPGLSLPHPEMHLRPEELIPAVEVWPDLQHPVLKQSLHSLSASFGSSSWGEFFAQGHRLLDLQSSAE